MSSETGRHGQGAAGAEQQRAGWDQGRSTTRGGAVGDGSAVRVLRVSAYVLTSLASLLFIVVVIYGAVQLNRLSTALEEFGSSFPAFGSGSSSVAPPDMSVEDGYIGYTLTPDELDAYCPEVPDDPACAMR